MVDAEIAGDLRDPGSQRLVVAQHLEPLEYPGEDVLEDILGVVWRDPKRAHDDRVDVGGVLVDEIAPGVRITSPTAIDKRWRDLAHTPSLRRFHDCRVSEDRAEQNRRGPLYVP